ncbi:MAG: hypothetical protein P1V36_00550 [Planctomycetota bacterium]|nr:hypothetical protein [Planctomycetota bacterium]
MLPAPSRSLALLAFLLLGACVTHDPQVVTIDTAAESFEPHPDGPLAFEEAVRVLVARNPELRATRARIDAVNINPGPGTVRATQQVMDGRATELMVQTDLLALLGLGPRRAETAWARAVRDERLREHHQRARDLVADLAAAYAVEQALSALPSPKVEIDIDAFEQAGLASDSVLSAARGLQAEGAAEARVISARVADARREIARLIGAAPTSTILPVEWDAATPAIETPDRRQLILARGDLQTLMAAWHRADLGFKYEVERQFPTVVAGLGGNLDLNAPMQLIGVHLPLDAPARAKAARHAREAAFYDLESGVLAALHDAESALFELEAARARHDAARARVQAADDLLAAERAHLQTDPEGLGRVVFVGGRRVDAARMLRETSVAHARAYVGAARAAGWPAPELVEAAR